MQRTSEVRVSKHGERFVIHFDDGTEPSIVGSEAEALRYALHPRPGDEIDADDVQDLRERPGLGLVPPEQAFQVAFVCALVVSSLLTAWILS